MARKEVGRPIKLRRTSKKITDSSLTNEVPLFGEPVYIKGNASTDEQYIVVGDGVTPIPQLRRFKAFAIGEVDTQVFYDVYEQEEHGWAKVKLVDEKGIDLIPDTHANNVYWKTQANTDYTVKDGLDQLTDWKNTLNYAAAGSAGGAATSANKLNASAGSSTKPVFFNANGVPEACGSTLGTPTDPVNVTGSSGSCTGNAASASKLGSNAGSSTKPVYFTGGVPAQCGDSLAVSITGNAASATNSTNIKVQQSNGTTLYLTGVTATSTTNTDRALKQNSNIYVTTNNVLMGAAWNDFAEFRKTDAKAGYVVCEKGDGSLVLSTKRLQAAPAVVSDTYGMAIGITKEGYNPIAVAGRVLVYHDEEETFQPGDAVCAAPGGVVSVMTREEIKEYPDRILGYVSEIPTYKIWNEDNPVEVDNRIWIKVK